MITIFRIMPIILMLLPIMAMGLDLTNEIDIRSPVHNLDESRVTLDSSSFAGFYYDINKDIGTETVTFRLSNVDTQKSTAVLSDTQDADGNRGVIYQTTAQAANFKFKPWGEYDVIGFLADKYFAAYSNTVTANVQAGTVPFLADTSKNDNLMTNEQISKVLVDDNTERTITSANPLILQDGYQLAVKSIDTNNNKVYVELSKNSQVVDSKVIQPSIYNAMMADKTYYYKTKIGDTTDIVQIAAHFKNAFHGADTNIATVDGVFQISDTPTPLKVDQQYDKMAIREVNPNAMTVKMDNKDNQITLTKNKSISLMPRIYIKTADPRVIDAANPLRFYIYKNYTEPNTYQIRGAVHNLGEDQVIWDNSTYAGFFYDINKNIGAETLTFTLTGTDPAAKTLSDTLDANDNRGVVYSTKAKSEVFNFSDWGSFNSITFLGDLYFAGYIKPKDNTESSLLEYAYNTNLLGFGHLTKVLIDSGKEQILTLGSTLNLRNGYALKPTVGSDKKGILVELLNNGKVIDREALIPPDTYVYKTNVGNATGFPIIFVHLEEPIYVEGKGYCNINGLWQISEKPMTIIKGARYGNLTLETIDPSAMSISMDNKDYQITLSKNKDVVLMPNLHIRTADQDTITADTPLRFYIYQPVNLQKPGGK